MSRQQKLTLVATILGSTVVFLDATVVNVALPAIKRGLGMGLSGQQWVVEAYLLSLTALLLVGGSMGDQFGRRRVFEIGLAGFAATSVICALAPSEGVLIGARGLQGVAGALLVPGSLAILAATFEGAERGRAVGRWTAWSGIATVLGPAGGGALVQALSWRAIFWVNIPVIAATILICRSSVAESRDPDAYRGIDVGGVLLSALGLGGPVFALIEEPSRGWGDPVVLTALIGGLLCFAAFLVHEARAEHPMLTLSLFRVRNFTAANLTTVTTYAGLIGGLLFVGLFLQQVGGYTPLRAGLATTPVSLILFFLSPRFGRISVSTGPRIPMTVGPIVAGVGMLMMLRLNASADYLSQVLPAVCVFGFGLAAVVAPLTATVLDSVEERHVGIASGINNAVSRTAGLLAIAVLGVVIAGRFGATLDRHLAGVTLSPAGERAVASARSATLAGSGKSGLGASERAIVEPAVRSASVDAFHLGAELAAALMVSGGLIAFALVRDPRREAAERPYSSPRAAAAGECGHPGEPEPHSEEELAAPQKAPA